MIDLNTLLLARNGGGSGGGGLPTGGTPYKQLVTDGDGNAKWEDRLAYEYTAWKDFVLNDGDTEITEFKMPPVGETVTVKVNGVESVETVKSAEVNGFAYSYIGSIDIMGLMSGNNGWVVGDIDTIYGLANPETTISFFVTEQHKIDEKYIQQDKAFVRFLSYYIGDFSVYKIFYKESGDEILTYKCSNIIVPPVGTVFICDMSNIGIGKAGNVKPSSFFASIYIFTSYATSEGTGSSFTHENFIFGTDESEIAEIAADYGYTLTTKPTT